MKHILAPLTLFLTLTFIVSSFYSGFSGFTADQLPIPQVDPPVQPAGYAFSIWGLIYGMLLAGGVFGLLKRRIAPDWDRGRLPLAISLLIGTPWLAVASRDAIAATVMILLMAAFAIIALARAPARDRFWFQLPMALYAGWLTAAAFVALASTSAGYGLITDSLGWAYIGIGAAFVVAVLVLWRLPQAPEYAFTVVWALIGIIVTNGTLNAGVSLTAAAGAIVLTAFAARQFLTSPRKTAA